MVRRRSGSWRFHNGDAGYLLVPTVRRKDNQGTRHPTLQSALAEVGEGSQSAACSGGW